MGWASYVPERCASYLENGGLTFVLAGGYDNPRSVPRINRRLVPPAVRRQSYRPKAANYKGSSAHLVGVIIRRVACGERRVSSIFV
jgi:hypothetical protein